MKWDLSGFDQVNGDIENIANELKAGRLTKEAAIFDLLNVCDNLNNLVKGLKLAGQDDFNLWEQEFKASVPGQDNSFQVKKELSMSQCELQASIRAISEVSIAYQVDPHNIAVDQVELEDYSESRMDFKVKVKVYDNPVTWYIDVENKDLPR